MQVFWNPRLSHEHERLVALIGASDLVFDVFAGVGPFAIPAARKGTKSRDREEVTRVFANDLNPESVKWLGENVGLNQVR